MTGAVPSLEEMRLAQYDALAQLEDIFDPDLVERACWYAIQSSPENTRKNYGSTWRQFVKRCNVWGVSALPADPITVAMFITERAATLKVSSLAANLSAIAAAHRYAKLPSPTRDFLVRDVLKGIAVCLGSEALPKRPLRAEQVRAACLLALEDPNRLQGLRDRAILTVGVVTAVRRANLAALTVEDGDVRDDRYFLKVRRSKTDQIGRGYTVMVGPGLFHESCPLRSLTEWLEAAGITTGPFFRKVSRWGVVGEDAIRPDSITRIVKKYTKLLGLDPTEYGAHSLRSGFCVSAHEAGAAETEIMKQTNQHTVAALRRYLRDVDPFLENPTRMVGL